VDERTVIAENVARVRERIATAAIQAGRDPGAVRLVAVTKYADARRAALVAAAGCIDLGESRPQELWTKAADAELAGAHWHLVGRLQRNKVRRTLPLVDLIHSVDSERLLATIDEHAKALGLAPRVLVEVNASREATKQGFEPEALERALATMPRDSNVQIIGLMTMAPLEGGARSARACFASLRALRDKLASATPPNVSLTELSMGMSGDFPEAIAEGATIVRIGSLLFEGVSR
jgi:pyridoxal phosphate enzyme (YggS family)